MKKANVIVLTIILSIIFLGIEIIIVRKAAQYEPKRSVVYAGVNIKAGEIIREEMLEEKETGISNIHEQSFRSKDEIIGKKAEAELFEGEMVLAGRLNDGTKSEEIKVLDKKNRLFTVEFKGDQVNGWWLQEGQYVDIIFIPDEKAQKEILGANSSQQGTELQKAYSAERIKSVRVAAIIDDKGNLIKEDTESTSMPKYISFEVDEVLDEFLAYAKGNGRLEISVIPITNGNY